MLLECSHFHSCPSRAKAEDQCVSLLAAIVAHSQRANPKLYHFKGWGRENKREKQEGNLRQSQQTLQKISSYGGYREACMYMMDFGLSKSKVLEEPKTGETSSLWPSQGWTKLSFLHFLCDKFRIHSELSFQPMKNIWGKLLLIYNQILKKYRKYRIYWKENEEWILWWGWEQSMVKWPFPFNISTLNFLMRASHTLRRNKKATN